MPVKKPCIDCGHVCNGTRCDDCERQRRERLAEVRARRAAEQPRKPRSRGGRPQYAGDYKKRAQAVRDSATVCWLCGEGDRGSADPWQADHLFPAAQHGGEGPLIAAHRSCNIARANRLRAKPRPDLTDQPNGRRGVVPPYYA